MSSYLSKRDTTNIPPLKVKFYNAACEMKDVYSEFADQIDEFHQHLMDLCATDAGYTLIDPLMAGFMELDDRSHVNDYKELCAHIHKCNQQWDQLSSEQQERISEIIRDFREYIQDRQDKLSQLNDFFQQAAPIDRSKIKKTATLMI